MEMARLVRGKKDVGRHDILNLGDALLGNAEPHFFDEFVRDIGQDRRPGAARRNAVDVDVAGADLAGKAAGKRNDRTL